MRSVPVLLAAIMLAGCASGRLIPVQGPLLSRTPVPTYQIKLDYGDAISARLAHGESCTGNWLDVVQGDPAARDLSAEWDLVYGKGFFNASVLGQPGIARSNLNCNKNTKVTVEFNSVEGVAKDGDGNVYKLTF